MNNNIPAFPRTAFNESGHITTWDEEFQGMTLRDYFAAMALQGAVSNHYFNLAFAEDEKLSSKVILSEYLAKQSYSMADAMLNARGEK